MKEYMTGLNPEKLKEIVHLRKKHVANNLGITVFYCVIKNKHLLSLRIISLQSFVIFSFIKSIIHTSQIHQPITFDYFEHQPITDEMGETCGDRVKTI